MVSQSNVEYIIALGADEVEDYINKVLGVDRGMYNANAMHYHHHHPRIQSINRNSNVEKENEKEKTGQKSRERGKDNDHLHDHEKPEEHCIAPPNEYLPPWTGNLSSTSFAFSDYWYDFCIHHPYLLSFCSFHRSTQGHKACLPELLWNRQVRAAIHITNLSLAFALMAILLYR